MSTQTAYFNLITRLTTETKPGSKQKLSSWRSELGKLGDASTMAGKAVATAAGFITYQLVSTALMGVVNFVQGSIDEFVKFEYAMAGVARTVSDFAKNEAQLSAFASTMSTELGISATEVAEAMQFMGSVGYSSSEIMRDFNDIAQMSVALQIDLSQAIETVVKAQQVWNAEAYTATEISDLLNNMTNQTALNMDFLSGALRMGGAAAAATNTDLEMMTAILVELAETGFQGTMAGRSLNTILIQMGLKAGIVTEQLQTLADQGFDANMDAMVGFEDALPIDQIQMLAKATEGLSDRQRIQIAQTIAGTNFLKQMLILMNNAGDLTENYAKALNSAGSSQEEFNIVMNTTQKQMEINTQMVEELQRKIGEDLAQSTSIATRKYWEFIGALAEGVGEWEANTREIQRQEQMMITLYQQYKDNKITLEQYTEYIELNKQGLVRWGTVAKKTITIVDDYTDASVSNTQALMANYNAIATKKDADLDAMMALSELMAAEEEQEALIESVKDVTDEYSRTMDYLSGKLTDAEYALGDLTWATNDSRMAYDLYSDTLDFLNIKLQATTDAMMGLEDAMDANNLSTAELRLEQMELDKAFEEGTISEEEYEEQTEAIRKKMRDLRIEAQKTRIAQMNLKDAYEDQTDAVRAAEEVIQLLIDADDDLEASLEGLDEDLQATIKNDLAGFMLDAATATGGVGTAIEELERITGVSITEMMDDWDTYKDLLENYDWFPKEEPEDTEPTGGKQYRYTSNRGEVSTGWWDTRAQAKAVRDLLISQNPNLVGGWSSHTSDYDAGGGYEAGSLFDGNPAIGQGGGSGGAGFSSYYDQNTAADAFKAFNISINIGGILGIDDDTINTLTNELAVQLFEQLEKLGITP
jgi:TP901 family phage tail tape measure protein